MSYKPDIKAATADFETASPSHIIAVSLLGFMVNSSSQARIDMGTLYLELNQLIDPECLYSQLGIGRCLARSQDDGCAAGFIQQFAAVCDPDRADTNMAAVLKQLSGGRTPSRVICCGHSLGGALATLGDALTFKLPLLPDSIANPWFSLLTAKASCAAPQGIVGCMSAVSLLASTNLHPC